MNSFYYRFPVRVYFGEGAAQRALPEELAKVGKKVMLAYGQGSIKKNGVYEEITGLLKAAGKEIVEFPGIMPNPTYAKALEGAALCKREGVDFVLAVGGGSVLDCCKVIAAQAGMEEDIWELGHGGQKALDHSRFLPAGCVLTAFGTGAEMNNGAVITNQEKMIKDDVFSAFFDFAILDPKHTMSTPIKQVMTGSFDTLSHCLESYMGEPRYVNLTDEMNEACMRNIVRSMRDTLQDPEDLFTRSELIWDSGMAETGVFKIGKKTDFQAHMLEHQLGAYTDCSHGQGLAVIHPVMYQHMVKEAEVQFARLAEVVWGVDPAGKSRAEMAQAFVDQIAAFVKEVGLPSTFAELGIPADTDYRAIADSTQLTGGCPRKFDAEELYQILLECR